METIDEQAVLDSFKEPKTQKARKTQPHRIKIGGRFVRLSSGKALWNNIGPTKNALINHLNNVQMPSRSNLGLWYKTRMTKAEIKEFTEKHVEFVPVSTEVE